jgi:serine acetyltransferase
LGGVIQNGVLIGEIDGFHASPIIEEGVFIGAKAIILGPIKVGRNSKIGAGAVVLQDVPAGCTVVGNPARIIRKQEVD